MSRNAWIAASVAVVAGVGGFYWYAGTQKAGIPAHDVLAPPVTPEAGAPVATEEAKVAYPLPAEVPIGLYNVEIKLFADGQLVTKTDTAFEIVKVGFEQFVATTAQQHGFVYGLITAAMALMTGWMASIVFRKD